MKILSVSFLLFVTAFTLSAQNKKVIPNDPFFKYQYSYDNPGGRLKIEDYSYKTSPKEFDAIKGFDAGITKAWAITTGSKKIVVAILEDGFFYDHEDLRENIWKNSGETGPDKSGYPKETNGIDDDGNGYIDDVIGWDFAFNDPDPEHYVFDGMDSTVIKPAWHSSAVMGIIGAKGNNGIGVSGINWDISMMLLKISAMGHRGPDLQRNERAAKAIHYAADNGVKIINWSGFASDLRPETIALLQEAVDYAEKKGVLLVVAAGNYAKNVDLKENYIYPSCFENDNILSVAEIDFKGDLLRFTNSGRIFGSNYGEKNVDIAAIGMNYSTFLKYNISTYAMGEGTSCAAPVVSGTAALLLSIRPDLIAADLKKILLESATHLPSLKGVVRCGGMVNAFSALQLAQGYHK